MSIISYGRSFPDGARGEGGELPPPETPYRTDRWRRFRTPNHSQEGRGLGQSPSPYAEEWNMCDKANAAMYFIRILISGVHFSSSVDPISPN